MGVFSISTSFQPMPLSTYFSGILNRLTKMESKFQLTNVRKGKRYCSVLFDDGCETIESTFMEEKRRKFSILQKTQKSAIIS